MEQTSNVGFSCINFLLFSLSPPFGPAFLCRQKGIRRCFSSRSTLGSLAPPPDSGTLFPLLFRFPTYAEVFAPIRDVSISGCVLRSTSSFFFPVLSGPSTTKTPRPKKEFTLERKPKPPPATDPLLFCLFLISPSEIPIFFFFFVLQLRPRYLFSP